MSAQAQEQEHTTVERKVQQWLLCLLLRYGPGRYVMDVATDGRIEVKRLRPPLRFVCPVQWEGEPNRGKR